MPPLRCLLLLLFAAAPLHAVPVANNNLPRPQGAPQGHVRAALVSETLTVAPGRPFTVALHFKIAPLWHTYWRNPGDAGLATQLTWSLPPGFTVSDLQWPAPRRLDVADGLTNFGYENEAWHLVTVTPLRDLPPNKPVTLTARAGWLECADTCVPGGADLRLPLTVSGTITPSPQFAAIQGAKKLLPVRDDNITVSAAVTASRPAPVICLQFHNPAAAEATFFPYDEQLIANSAPQLLVNDGEMHSLLIPLAEDPQLPRRLRGVLVSAAPWDSSGATALEIDVPLTDSRQVGQQPGVSFFVMLVSGFAGGLLLNLMPCVFPVLGVKVLGFVNQGGRDRGKIVRHGLAFTGGVLVSFWLLAGLLIALRAGGQQLGWGFQLQSPVFVYTLTVILLLCGLNLSGVFEFNLALRSWREPGNRLAGSFLSGALTAVLATPCAAPFLATALGAALTLAAVPALLLFTAIALGLAAPYLAISAKPRLLNFLPRPGAWMVTVRQLLAFPLYASVAWLVWVLAAQVGGSGLLRALLALTVTAFAAWLCGHGQRAGANWWRFGIVAGAWLLALAALFRGAPAGGGADGEHLKWLPWSPELVEQLRAEGRPVYVDFTARWCATCQVNEALVFGSRDVREKFHALNVALLRADWTTRDPRITAELARHGRSAVPFNLVYLPGKDGPIQLPEILTPQIVLDAVSSSP